MKLSFEQLKGLVRSVIVFVWIGHFEVVKEVNEEGGGLNK